MWVLWKDEAENWAGSKQIAVPFFICCSRQGHRLGLRNDEYRRRNALRRHCRSWWCTTTRPDNVDRTRKSLLLATAVFQVLSMIEPTLGAYWSFLLRNSQCHRVAPQVVQGRLCLFTFVLQKTVASSLLKTLDDDNFQRVPIASFPASQTPSHQTMHIKSGKKLQVRLAQLSGVRFAANVVSSVRLEKIAYYVDVSPQLFCFGSMRVQQRACS